MYYLSFFLFFYNTLCNNQMKIGYEQTGNWVQHSKHWLLQNILNAKTLNALENALNNISNLDFEKEYQQ